MGNSVSNEHRLPAAFIWRRLQSLMGLFIVFFLIEHLLTNSQAALLIGDDGSGFVRGVNFIKNLPYLPAIEIGLLGIPFFIHIVWGIHYLLTAKPNSYGDSGKEPYLPHYPRNHAYTWQRLTSWILLIAIAAHVAQMRFIDYPASAKRGATTYYAAPVSLDEGIYTVAKRLNVALYTAQQIQHERQQLLYADNYGKGEGEGGIQQFLIAMQELFSPGKVGIAGNSKAAIHIFMLYKARLSAYGNHAPTTLGADIGAGDADVSPIYDLAANLLGPINRLAY
jgi:succinate dehydrogenase/fumarate reductase cytochrome b subunit